MNESSKTGCPELAAHVRPDLYQTNAFRILGLGVHDTPQEARRRRQRLEMQRKLGVEVDASPGMYPLTKPATDEDSRAALDRVGDPKARIFDEFFWFWPVASDAVADADAKVESGDAPASPLDDWHRAAKAGDSQALHNVAVAEHLQLLEATGDGSSDEAAQWESVFANWLAVVNDDGVWDGLRERIIELDDASLTTGLVRRIRTSLPGALLSINAALAREAAVAGDLDKAAVQVRAIRAAPFDATDADRALKDAVEPLRRRLMAAIDHAKARHEANPIEGLRTVDELEHVAIEQLAVLDAMLPDGDIARTGLHDLIGEAMLEAAISYVNKTEDWNTGLELIERVRAIAAGASLQGKLDGHVDTLKDNVNDVHGWCGPGYWDQSAESLQAAEEIRAAVRSGDHENAMRQLVALGAAEPDSPLSRSLGFTLNGAAIRLHDEALSLHKSVSDVMRRLLDKLADLSQSELISRLSDRPDPNGFFTPPCLSCGSTSYTSWVKFTHKDVPLFMCSTCSADDDKYHERNETKVKGLVRRAIARAMLAAELEPEHEGIAQNLARLDEQAKELDIKRVSTKPLRKELGLQPLKSKPARKRRPAASAASSVDGGLQGEAQTAAVDGWAPGFGAVLLCASALALMAWIAFPASVGLEWYDARSWLTATGIALLLASALLLRGALRLVAAVCLLVHVAMQWWPVHLPLEPYASSILWVLPVAALSLAVRSLLTAAGEQLAAWIAGLALSAFVLAHTFTVGVPALVGGSLLDLTLADLAGLARYGSMVAAAAWAGLALAAMTAGFSSLNRAMPASVQVWGARLLAVSFMAHVFHNWLVSNAYQHWFLDFMTPLDLIGFATVLMLVGAVLMWRASSSVQTLLVLSIAIHFGLWWLQPDIAAGPWLHMGAWATTVVLTTARVAALHLGAGNRSAAIQAVGVLLIFVGLKGVTFTGFAPASLFLHLGLVHAALWCWLIVLLLMVSVKADDTTQHERNAVVVGA